MYSSFSEHTRVPWSAHSFNIAFSDETGHFEFCNAFDSNFNCTKPGIQDNALDSDDFPCANPAFFGLPSPPFQPITGCLGEDLDFDGVPYGKNWPGTNASTDETFHPIPIRFTSPTFNGPD